MNNKLKYILVIFSLLLLSLVISTYKVGSKKVIHQHLENKKEVITEISNEFNTHLPILSIDTGNQEIPGEKRDGTTIKASIKLYDDKKKNNYLSDEPIINANANIRYRGNSSMHFDKKGYLLKFIKENGEDKKVDILDMGKHDEWALHGPFLDKTLIRNYMWYNISSEIMEYAPEVRFCELFVDGKYQGIYVITETIKMGDGNRVPIQKYKKNNKITSYILRLDRGSKNEIKNINNFTKYTKRIKNRLCINIEYPAASKLNNQLNEYISDDLSKFEKTIYSFDYKKYNEYIDVDSFVDYFIINEFTQNYDVGGLSTYIYKDVRGKYKLCIWDFNSACDNFKKSILDKDFAMQDIIWYKMILKDPKFVDRVIERYHELRKTYLSEEYLLNYIDEASNYLGDAKKRNFEVWGYTFESENDMLPEGRKIASYDEAINQMKDYIVNRGRWLDENIEQLYQFSHESVNKKYNH